jgi:hypothetical protein
MSQSGTASTKAPSASAGASTKSGASARYDFDKADKNKDGRLSREEFNDMMKGGSASAGAGASGAGSTGSSAAKTPSSSGKMNDKPRTSK